MSKVLPLLLAYSLFANCAPGDAEAIALHRKAKGRPGLTSSQHLVRCNDFVCEGSETSVNCPKDCFADAASANLDGVDEYFTCAAWSTVNWNKLSFSMWYRPTAAPASSDPILLKNSTPREFVTSHGSADASKVRFSPTTSSSNWCETDTGRLANGIWSHITVVFDGTQTTNAAACKIFINGTDRTSTYNGTVYSTSVTAGGAPILIAANTAGGIYSPALVDDVAIWKGRVLTSAEVTTVYNAGDPASLFALNPTYWWKMGDDPLDNFDSTSGSKLLVDAMGLVNCTPVNTEGADLSATVP